jgi:hypothetical protein
LLRAEEVKWACPEAPTKLIAIAVLGGIAACATAAVQTGGPARDEIIFSHNTHARARLGCGTCHESSYDAKKPAGEFRPAMSKCLECHEQWKAADQCGRCHTDVRHAAPWQSRS